MHSFKCPQCGLFNFADAEACKRCRAPIATGAREDGARHDAFTDDAASTEHNVSADAAAFAEESRQATAAVCPFCARPVSGAYCTLCHAQITSPAATAMPYETSEGGSPARGSKRVLLLGAALVCVAVFALLATGSLPLSSFAKPDYARLIQDSELFKKPLSVRVNRKPLQQPESKTAQSNVIGGNPKGPSGYAVGSAYVLEGMGLLTIGTATNSFVHPYDAHLVGRPGLNPRTLDSKYVTSVALTERGRRESGQWEEFDAPALQWEEALPAEQQKDVELFPWWRVPIGEREFVEVVSASEVRRENGREVLDVVFAWHWRPNKVGQAFDLTSVEHSLLPRSAKEIAERLGRRGDSRVETTAMLERVDGAWKVTAFADLPRVNEGRAPWTY